MVEIAFPNSVETLRDPAYLAGKVQLPEFGDEPDARPPLPQGLFICRKPVGARRHHTHSRYNDSSSHKNPTPSKTSLFD